MVVAWARFGLSGSPHVEKALFRLNLPECFRTSTAARSFLPHVGRVLLSRATE